MASGEDVMISQQEGPVENDTTDEGNTTIEEEEEDSGFINIREDAMSRPGVDFCLDWLYCLFSLTVSAWISFKRLTPPRRY